MSELFITMLTENHTRTRQEWEKVLSSITHGFITYNVRETMYDSGHGQTARLKSLEVWKSGDHIFDLACGNGRLAIPLTEEDVEYDGMECVEGSVLFCRKAFEPWADRFRFHHCDVWNGEYNPDGKLVPTQFSFPFEDETFDSVLCSSIFTHIGTEEACRHYLSEVGRVMKSGGKAWITWFRSPPNEVSSGCKRTVFKESAIINMLDGFEVEYTNCGFTDSWHDQWEMVLRKR